MTVFTKTACTQWDSVHLPSITVYREIKNLFRNRGEKRHYTEERVKRFLDVLQYDHNFILQQNPLKKKFI